MHSILRSDHPEDGPSYILPSPLPLPGKLEKPPQPTAIPTTPQRKRALDADTDGSDLAPPAKRPKSDKPLNNVAKISPNKNKRFEEDGFLIIDDIEEEKVEENGLMSEVINID